MTIPVDNQDDMQATLQYKRMAMATSNPPRGDSKIAVALCGIRKRLGDREVLCDVDLAVRSGESLCIVGPSGCGKTTLLRIVAGLEAADAGSVLLDGRDQLGVATEQRQLGFVFQELALYPHLSVEENLAFPLRMQKVDRRERGKRVQELAEWFELTDLLRRYPNEMSGGQRQRVAIGRALIRQPRVLLMDEPFSQLDAGLRLRLRESIFERQRQFGSTTIVVTHDPGEAMAMADRVVVMDQGQIVQAGSPEEVSRNCHTRFVADFFGSYPMNWIAATGEADGTWSLPRPWQWVGNRSGWKEGDCRELGFRPSDAVLIKSDTSVEEQQDAAPAGIEGLFVVQRLRWLEEHREVWVSAAERPEVAWRVLLRHGDAQALGVGNSLRLRVPSECLRLFASDGSRRDQSSE